MPTINWVLDTNTRKAKPMDTMERNRFILRIKYTELVEVGWSIRLIHRELDLFQPPSGILNHPQPLLCFG